MNAEAKALGEQAKKLDPEAARRVMHSEVRLLPRGKTFARVTSLLGTQVSKRLRLLGQAEDAVIAEGEDPRRRVMEWMRRKDNPYFARVIVNRVWARYFGRGITNYASFSYRRLPAEVLVDALNQATGTPEKMDREYHHWPKEMKTVEIPFTPRNTFVTFMLSTFGKSNRNAAVQCDCERDTSASALQVLSLANHPRVRQKIADDAGAVARIVREIRDDAGRVEEIFLLAMCRLPTPGEREACMLYLEGSESPRKGCEGVLWTLVNTRGFVLQH